MNKRQTQRGDQMTRIIRFLLVHQITPAIARATVLRDEVASLQERLLESGSSQEGGGNIFRSGAAQRRALRNEILFAVAEISGTARALDPEEHPGIRDLFRLNEADKSYQRLVNTCSSFLEQLAKPAVKSLFTERGFDSDFDSKLTAKLAAFASATGVKYQGRQMQKAGTVALDALNRRATVVIRELSAIVLKYLRKTAPMLVPVWMATARAYTPAVASPKASPANPDSADVSQLAAATPILETNPNPPPATSVKPEHRTPFRALPQRRSPLPPP